MDEPKQIVNPEHITYREYKKRLSHKPFQSLVLFISAFFILLLAFLGMAKVMSPDVDIAIGDEPEVVYEEEGIIRGNVDDRLKQIQAEDNSVSPAADSSFSPELDEKVKIPEKKQQDEQLQAQEEEPILLETQKPETVLPNENTVKAEQPKQPAQAQTPKHALNSEPEIPQAPVPVASTKVYKVYVGSYASAEQAEIAKGIISESNIGVNAFVKNLNGSYTLQAGSYSSADKAQNAANDLLRNNFPARVVAE